MFSKMDVQSRVNELTKVMSQSDVFRPANGNLEVRSNLADGLGPSMETFRKPSARPSTQSSGYRFGRLSHNSFFARHNPHPGRVRHIKGLLDVPICAVTDDGYFSNPRYSLNFPPNSHNQKQLQKYSLPANAINVNSQTHPINTITGLQYFIGKPLNFRVFREKAVPKIGMVPVTESWRQELSNLTNALGMMGHNREQPKPAETRPRTSQYSATTGRLIPPPSRAMSRGASRGGPPTAYAHITEDPDMENTVLEMLAQILQTDDINSVQAWLVSAPDREKTLVLDMIRAAMGSGQEYYKQYNPESFEKDPLGRNPLTEGQSQPNCNGIAEEISKNIDRLSLDDPTSRPTSQQNFVNPFPQRIASAQAAKHPEPILEEADPKYIRFQTPKIFKTPEPCERPKSNHSDRPKTSSQSDRPKSSSQSDRPQSGLARVKSPKRTPTPKLSSEPTLRYVRTPIPEQDVTSQKASINDILSYKPKEVFNPQSKVFY